MEEPSIASIWQLQDRRWSEVMCMYLVGGCEGPYNGIGNQLLTKLTRALTDQSAATFSSQLAVKPLRSELLQALYASRAYLAIHASASIEPKVTASGKREPHASQYLNLSQRCRHSHCFHPVECAIAVMAGHAGSSSPVSSILERLADVAGQSTDIEHDQQARASLLQLSRELTANLEQPDEVVSLLAFSVPLPFTIERCVRSKQRREVEICVSA